MIEIIFTYNDTKINLNYKRNEPMINVFNIFILKTNLEIKNISFLYGGNEINNTLTFDEIAKPNDKKLGKLRILVYEINNSINLIYKVNKNEEEIRIFGKTFVNNNINNYKIICEDKQYELKEYFDTEKFIKKGILKLILTGISKIKNISYMFNKCSSLISLEKFSNLNTKNIMDMNHLFYGCSSLISLPDISNWDISNVTDISYIFSGCILL